jgi:hypothetical protein
MSDLSVPPIRVPEPAATRTTSTSIERLTDRFAERRHGDHFQTVRGGLWRDATTRCGDDRARKPVARRLAEPSPKSRHGAQLSEKSNLADRHRLATDRSITLRRRKCEREREVERRLIKDDAADEVRVDVAIANGNPRSSAEDGGEEGESRGIKATPRAPRCAECGARDECLYLHEHRTTPLKEWGDHRTRCPRLTLVNKGAARILNAGEATLPHLEESKFIG